MSRTSSETDFFEVLRRRIAATNSLLCVGLDPALDAHPHDGDDGRGGSAGTGPRRSGEDLARECIDLIEKTQQHACCFKPNVAFFEALGADGVRALKGVCDFLVDSQLPFVLDAKRGDIGSTAEAYATCCFDYYRAPAVTVSPYLGRDSIEPFLAPRGFGCCERGVFVLCKTSNPGAADLQTLRTSPTASWQGGCSESARSPPPPSSPTAAATAVVIGDGGAEGMLLLPSSPLYLTVAAMCATMNRQHRKTRPTPNHREDSKKGEKEEENEEGQKEREGDDGPLGLVVGATDPDALRAVRLQHPRMWLLCPGLGAQGGDMAAAVAAGLRLDGSGMIIPMSRAIARAEDPAAAAAQFRERINEARVAAKR
eukprot:GHVU01048360.1.p1 GENE.GHVU01048360.1~~GHVU01048360.1.p1  ORF type:complete len:369 (-),score=60.29 GHVU01048360.1:1388-2494(-)